ncbi:MAG: hypothetical protein UX44_C0027G0008 [candidate division WWE3 bacterium GW2011_GWA1_46_21]|uniref:Uncharacterized protein n=1 Tax=candidate division WWE3 bacterium GW2011_GWA1_46_21 TaxID=1619107 RepID=A0A0G1RJF4_UNCKA|nr:MAG: hypothetical protein UX44_C0027G0008 [candidate division WWE3 bacterium GW2011_GWA1_46_21]
MALFVVVVANWRVLGMGSPQTRSRHLPAGSKTASGRGEMLGRTLQFATTTQ